MFSWLDKINFGVDQTKKRNLIKSEEGNIVRETTNKGRKTTNWKGRQDKQIRLDERMTKILEKAKSLSNEELRNCVTLQLQAKLYILNRSNQQQRNRQIT